MVNINRSLNEILQENPAVALFPWARRWVPETETYGLYLPAGDDKAKDAVKKGYAIAVKNGNDWAGLPEREKDAAYLTKARSEWLKLYGETYGPEPESIQAGLETLRADLARITGEVQTVHGILDRFASIDQWWRGMAGELAPRSFIEKEEAALTAGVDQATEVFQGAEAAASAARTSRDAVAAKIDAAARAAERTIGQHQVHMHQLIGIKGKVLAAISLHGFLEALAEALPFFRSLFVHKRVARLCALAAQDPLIGELFERDGLAALVAGAVQERGAKAAFVILHKLREAIEDGRQGMRLSGEVEIDGAYYGGHVRPPNAGRQGKRSGVRFRKQCVLTMVARSGGTVAVVIGSENTDEVPDAAHRHIQEGSIVYADEHGAYDALHARYEMHRINHRWEHSRDGHITTNAAESFHSRMRRAEIGQYHHISGRYLLRYSHEMAYRSDRRRVDNGRIYAELAEMTLTHPISREWKGYWQKRA